MDDDPYHVPQQSRRHKLRYHPHHHNHRNNDIDIDIVVSQHHHPFLSPLQVLQPTSSASSSADHPPIMAAASTNLSLSSSSAHARAYLPSPVGPFTGYASILGRSRFLRPAQEILEEFSRASGVSFEKQGPYKILEDSGTLFNDTDDDLSLRCSNPNLVSMLHEVYKRYKLYCQQMQSAVSSFESVAGLGNAAPFLCFAVRAMIRHFQCLKNAILDQIRVTSKAFSSSVDTRSDRTPGSCSEDKGPSPNFLQHPVWRSQRGFPDKAVAVLKNWLFEHFLHPYPSDSDKHMLAQKTGLSRSQVSNWFTNARVRLWKPMVEEMHAFERKTQCSKAEDTPKFFSLVTDQQTSLQPQLSEKDFQITYSHRDQDNSHCKRSKIEAFPRAEQGKEQFSMLCNRLPNNQVLDVGGSHSGAHISHSSAIGSNQDNTTGLSWSNHGQIVPFWLAKQ
ncbi:BEL1-like homeodomain protein 9 [Chenopodium quinoa]|uniref:Homeobox domain-containing protein n=1 Tax=Chenopodium quinoa TaxID=63459 RepID=A0A803M3J3_CHEQI|nr:BEL1-like homeodomain protein 9 [Chenopodium quinoa]